MPAEVELGRSAAPARDEAGERAHLPEQFTPTIFSQTALPQPFIQYFSKVREQGARTVYPRLILADVPSCDHVRAVCENIIYDPHTALLIILRIILSKVLRE